MRVMMPMAVGGDDVAGDEVVDVDGIVGAVADVNDDDDGVGGGDSVDVGDDGGSAGGGGANRYDHNRDCEHDGDDGGSGAR